MKNIYGPVQSRRLGVSLGISLTPHKTCSFDCVYCQLGGSARRTRERKEYVPVNAVLEELRGWLGDNAAAAGKLDFVTLSGSGEPVLHSGIGRVIAGIKELTRIPVCLITNSSLLVDPAVRKSILGADVIVPSLDAAEQGVFERIDRPLPGMRVEEIIAALEALRGEYAGRIWLEVMLVKGVNDSREHVGLLAEAVRRIRPDKVQLISPVRCTAEQNVFPVERSAMESFCGIIGGACEVY